MYRNTSAIETSSKHLGSEQPPQHHYKVLDYRHAVYMDRWGKGYSLHCSYHVCFSKHVRYGRWVSNILNFVRNVFRWNLMPLTRSLMGTVEIRQPSGSSNATETKLWVTFAASFTQMAVLFGDGLNNSATDARELQRPLDQWRGLIRSCRL